MNIIVIDDEELALSSVKRELMKIVPDAEIRTFSAPAEAAAYLEDHPCDVVFLDIEMGTENGVAMAQSFRTRYPRMNIVFVTGYSEYIGEAMNLHASGYIMKPVTESKLRKELEDLRYQVPLSSRRITIRMIGGFDIFDRQLPIAFGYNKTRELMAYLAHRNGAYCSNQELAAALWGESRARETKGSYLSNLKSDLVRTLEEHGCGDVIARQRGLLAIVPSRVNCDYYDWLKTSRQPNGTYPPQYLPLYEWAHEKGK